MECNYKFLEILAEGVEMGGQMERKRCAAIVRNEKGWGRDGSNDVMLERLAKEIENG